MRIGIDARKINDTGIGRYIENLVEWLLKVDSKNEYVLFLAAKDAGRLSFPESRVTKVIETAGKYSLKEHWALAAKAKELGLSLFHAPHYVLPLFMKTPSVVTVHDLIHLTGPGFHPAERAYARFMIGSAANRARRVITVSESTKNDMVSILGVPPEKISVILNGGGADFSRTSDEDIEGMLKQLGMAPGYFLFVGSDRPHKNLDAIPRVMDIMGDDCVFAIVGRVNDGKKAEFERFGGRTVFFYNLDKRHMQALYSGAQALLFPSTHEGFGLPPLEAMACGTPVVASDSSCIPEIVGDAAMLAAPTDYGKMAEGLLKLKNERLFRKEMVERGYERTHLFSWEKTAMMTLDVYRAAIS